MRFEKALENKSVIKGKKVSYIHVTLHNCSLRCKFEFRPCNYQQPLLALFTLTFMT